MGVDTKAQLKGKIETQLAVPDRRGDWSNGSRYSKSEVEEAIAGFLKRGYVQQSDGSYHNPKDGKLVRVAGQTIQFAHTTHGVRLILKERNRIRTGL